MDVDIERELNRRGAAPTELWIGLTLLAIVTIIALLLLNNDGRKDQFNTEKKTSYIKDLPRLKKDSYGKESI